MLIEMLKVILLGIVEGITEWLPISSTGHMILVDEFIKLNVPKDFMEMFLVVIQLGAILAVCVIYFHKLNPFSPKKSAKEKRETVDIWGKASRFYFSVGNVKDQLYPEVVGLFHESLRADWKYTNHSC